MKSCMCMGDEFLEGKLCPLVQLVKYSVCKEPQSMYFGSIAEQQQHALQQQETTHITAAASTADTAATIETCFKPVVSEFDTFCETRGSALLISMHTCRCRPPPRTSRLRVQIMLQGWDTEDVNVQG